MSMMTMPGPVQAAAPPKPQATKKTGLAQAVIGSDHLITVVPKGPDGKVAGAPREAYVRVRDRAYHPNAKVRFVCLHSTCAGKDFKSEAELLGAHDTTALAKRGELHVYAAWSEDLVDPADPASGSLGFLSSAPFAPAS